MVFSLVLYVNILLKKLSEKQLFLNINENTFKKFLKCIIMHVFTEGVKINKSIESHFSKVVQNRALEKSSLNKLAQFSARWIFRGEPLVRNKRSFSAFSRNRYANMLVISRKSHGRMATLAFGEAAPMKIPKCTHNASCTIVVCRFARILLEVHSFVCSSNRVSQWFICAQNIILRFAFP